MTRPKQGPGRVTPSTAGAVPLDARSLAAIANLQPTRTRFCHAHQEEHEEVLCIPCSQLEGKPVYEIKGS